MPHQPVVSFLPVQAGDSSTLIDYINTQRVKRAAQQLTTTDRSISEVAEEMGILDVNYFAKIFKRTFGMTPTRYRRENRKK